MKSQQRQIILFVDIFSSHSPNKGQPSYTLTNIKLQYFPTNCTSVIQPMDQGIIQAFKRRYRTRLVKRNLNQIEYGYTDNALPILDSINYLDEAWEEISAETIKNCYRKAGFKTKHCLSDMHMKTLQSTLIIHYIIYFEMDSPKQQILKAKLKKCDDLIQRKLIQKQHLKSLIEDIVRNIVFKF